MRHAEREDGQCKAGLCVQEKQDARMNDSRSQRSHGRVSKTGLKDFSYGITSGNSVINVSSYGLRQAD